MSRSSSADSRETSRHPFWQVAPLLIRQQWNTIREYKALAWAKRYGNTSVPLPHASTPELGALLYELTKDKIIDEVATIASVDRDSIILIGF